MDLLPASDSKEPLSDGDLDRPGPAQPFSVGIPSNPSSLYTPSSLTRVVDDDRAITRLLEMIVHRAGLTTEAAAQRLGMTPQSLRPYLKGRRKPTLKWLLRLCALCGAEIQIRLPEKPLR